MSAVRGFRSAWVRSVFSLCLVLGLSGCASIIEHQSRVAADGETSAIERRLWETHAFLRLHPDIRHRKLGFWYESQGDVERAVEAFEEAARFADKPSQAVLAEWYFEGRQMAPDPVRAYAWMDLAAERGYPLYLAKREQYWSVLDAGQREAALQLGQQLYADFGDAVARPRMERKLREGRMSMTGSRVGSPGRLTVLLPTEAGWREFPGSVYYRDEFWRADEYFEWFDRIHAAPPKGEVEVGPLRRESAGPSSSRPG